MKQRILVTALPNGISSSRSGAVNISAAISLQVQLVDDVLKNVPDMLNWPAKLQQAKFIVLVNDKPVEATVVSKPDPKLWGDLFSKSVKVKSFEQENLSGMPIVSYPVKHIVNFIKSITEHTGKNSANDLPGSTWYTGNTVFTDLSDYNVGPLPKRGREKPSMKQIVTNKGIGRQLRNRMKEGSGVIPFSTKANPSADFAQLKNFHGLYDKQPVPTYVPVEKPDFEFHDMLAVIAGYPQLQRRLGLVIDLQVTMPPGTAITLANPTIRVVPTGINYSVTTTVSCPPTAFSLTSRGFYAQPGGGSLIDKGHLKINTDDFTVFQVDTDGAGLKLCQMMDALQLRKAKHLFYAADSLIQQEQFVPAFHNETEKKEGLPSQRTTGIAVAKNGMAAILKAKFDRMNSLKTSLDSSGPAPTGIATSGTNASFVYPAEKLFADDVTLGYRMDIQPEDKGGKWFSLHKRNNQYSYLDLSGSAIGISGMGEDEGYIQVSATEENTPDGKQLKVGEVLARWEGWSLSVPRPGAALNDPLMESKEVYDKSNPAEKEREEAKYLTPGTAPFRLNVKPGIAPGSLPMLRFGKKYGLKIRTVDLAGNSTDINFLPENLSEAVVPGVRYSRYEPVDAPFLLNGTDIKDGESSEVLVIRSDENRKVSEYETANPDSKHVKPYAAEAVRFVKPPRCTVEMATTHEKMDQAMGKGNEANAQLLYERITKFKDPKIDESTDKLYQLKTVSSSKAQGLLDVEYLADPMAAGVTFFLSANDPNPKIPDPEVLTRRVSFFFDKEVKSDADADTPVDWEGWFNPKTFRVMLVEGGPSIDWNDKDRILKVALPKGLIFKMNYASFWRPSEIMKVSGVLQQMGLGNLADAVGQRVARGQHWMFSPWREITFVHAVQQPIAKANAKTFPYLDKIVPDRNYGENFALLNTRLFVHAPSTGQLDIDADWLEYEDDVTKDKPNRFPVKGKVFHFTTLYAVYEYVFGKVDKDNPFPPLRHLFNDTKHRMVNYNCFATTRYREYFTQLIADKGDSFRLTTAGNKIEKVNILSSARPAAPQVEYIIPIFEWERTDNGNLRVSTRFSGLRVYLKRPWFSSGEGEKLGVVLRGPQVAGATLMAGFNAAPGMVTTWGTDPTKLSAPLPVNIVPAQEHFLKSEYGENEKNLSVAESPSVRVNVAPYPVRFDPERKLHYADIMINTSTAYFPFIRFVLARYQPDSIRKNNTDVCLSPLVQCDYAQIPSLRAAAILFGATRNKFTARLVGNIYNLPSAPLYGTKLVFLAEPIDAPQTEGAHISIAGAPIDKFEIGLSPNDIKNNGFNIAHDFNLPAEYATKPYRVKVLEYEILLNDPLKPDASKPSFVTGTSRIQYAERLVFAEVYEVNL